MRKLLSFTLATLLLFSLVACDGNEDIESSTITESTENSLPENSEPVAPESSDPIPTEDEPSTDTSVTVTQADNTSKTTKTDRVSKTTTGKITKEEGSSTTTTGKTTKTDRISKTTTNKTTNKTTSKTTNKTTNKTTTPTTVPTTKISWETPATNYKADDYTACIDYRTPLTNTYNKLTKDKELTVVYFGGSLTNGYGCSDINKYSWRARSGEWLEKNFPDAKITTVDTAIGESGTYLGTYRVQKDVIGSKPDLLFIEYAINDAYSGADEETAAMRFETIVREVRKALPYCDIVTVLTTDVNYALQSKNLTLFPTAMGHNTIAESYGLPVVNIGAGMVRSIAAITGNGTWWKNSTIWNKYFIDSVHPNDDGHEQYYLCIKEYLENALLSTDYSGLSSVKRNVPAVQSNHLLDGNRQSIKGADMQNYCVAAGTANATYNTGTFVSSTSQTPHIGYYEVKKGGKITFTFNGTEFALWTNRTSPVKFRYSVDGGASVTKTFDKHSPTQIVSGLSSGEHTITIEASAASFKVGALFTRDETKQTRKGAK